MNGVGKSELRAALPQQRRSRRGLTVALLASGALAALAGAVSMAVAHAQNPAAATPTQVEAQAHGEDVTDTGAVPQATAAPGPTVKIVFKVVPPTRATVTWGKKKLGFIKPRDRLVVERPRDSGPLDVVVRAEGCVPVHTRAYTFTDTVVAVKVTPVDKKNTIFGYREAPPPDADGGTAPGMAPASGNPDGGIQIAP